HTRFKCDWSSDVCSSDLCHVESAKVSETAVSEIQIRHPYRVIENIIEVGAQGRSHSFADLEVLVQAEIDAPRPRPPQEVLSGYCRVGKDIRAHRRRCK